MVNPIRSESVVSGDSVTIPGRIRQHLAIEEGYRLRWVTEGKGAVRVEVLDRPDRTFADFEGYDDESETDAGESHDSWGV